MWGPGEEAIAREVCAGSAGAALLAPPTDLDALAAHLRAAALAVTNDTGPMHLAVACGVPALAIFLAPDAARWGHPGPRFAGVDAAAPGGKDDARPGGDPDRARTPEEAAPARAQREANPVAPAPLADLRAAEAAAAQLLTLTGPPRSESLPPDPP